MLCACYDCLGDSAYTIGNILEPENRKKKDIVSYSRSGSSNSYHFCNVDFYEDIYNFLIPPDSVFLNGASSGSWGSGPCTGKSSILVSDSSSSWASSHSILWIGKILNLINIWTAFYFNLTTFWF